MAFNYISFIVAKQTQTIQSLFFLFCHHSVSPLSPSVLILPSLSLFHSVFCSHSAITQSLLPSHLYSVSPQTLFCTQSLSTSHTSVLILATCSMDNLISQNGENAVNTLHGKSHTPRKVGFCYYCQVFYPNGKTKYEVTQKKHIR